MLTIDIYLAVAVAGRICSIWSKNQQQTREHDHNEHGKSTNDAEEDHVC